MHVPVPTLTTDVVLLGHTAPVHSVAFSPDGRTLASNEQVLRGSGIRLWDVSTGANTVVSTLPDGSGHALAFHPDGDILAASGDMNTVQLVDPTSGQ